MKRIIRFSKLFTLMVVCSSVVVISGIAGYFMHGINFGIDFQAGFIEKVKFAPTAFFMTYNGEKNIQLAQSKEEITLTIMSVDANNKVISFKYADYPTIGSFIAELQKIEGIQATILADANIPLNTIFISTEVSRLSNEPFRAHVIPAQIAPITPDELRLALASIPSVSVQQIGEVSERTFQIRLPDNGTYANANVELRALIQNALIAAYKVDNFTVLSTDFVGSRFSNSLARQAVLLVLGAMGLIFLYTLVRFRWNFALGAVLALCHDVLIMLAFVVWTQMEFNSTTIAAILTIVGYSINDTVVVFDRIRENMRLNPKLMLIEVLDIAQTEVLSRTIITTVTTMLAVISLYIFTDGSMKNFALALLVGMVSGVYSTIYIAGACITFSSGKKLAQDLLLGSDKNSASGIRI